MEPTDTACALVAELSETLAAAQCPVPAPVVDDLLARAELLAADVAALIDDVTPDVAADAVALYRQVAALCDDGVELVAVVRTAA